VVAPIWPPKGTPKQLQTDDPPRIYRGTRIIDVVVDLEGSVCDVRLVQGVEPNDDNRAMEHLRELVFASPSTVSGEPVASIVRTEIEVWSRE